MRERELRRRGTPVEVDRLTVETWVCRKCDRAAVVYEGLGFHWLELHGWIENDLPWLDPVCGACRRAYRAGDYVSVFEEGEGAVIGGPYRLCYKVRGEPFFLAVKEVRRWNGGAIPIKGTVKRRGAYITEAKWVYINVAAIIGLVEDIIPTVKMPTVTPKRQRVEAWRWKSNTQRFATKGVRY